MAGKRSTPVVVGSKSFTESVVLGEVATLLLRGASVDAGHRRELGGTRILFNALQHGDIDVYAEYTGTLIHEILQGRQATSFAQIEAELRQLGIRMTRPLGFNNTYAIGMRPETAERLGIRTISDLKHHPELRLGLTNEFMDRGDGWPRRGSTWSSASSFRAACACGEPLGALDPMIRVDLQADLREIFARLSKTVVLVTHNLAEAAYFGDSVVLLRAGRIVQQGPLRQLIEQPAEPFVSEFVTAQRSKISWD